MISEKLGPRVGYKVGMVTKAGQERLGLNGPLRGVLLKAMLLPDKSEVPMGFAIRPIVEPDLMVRVKDAGINEAKTIDEAARHLDEVIAFLELADATLSTNEAVSGGVIPDLRLSPITRDAAAWERIVRGGERSPRGMVSFAAEVSAEDSEKVRAYVIHRAHEVWNNEKAAAAAAPAAVPAPPPAAPK